MNARVNIPEDYFNCGIPFNAVLGAVFSAESNPLSIITVAYAKQWCKIDGDDDDAVVSDIIKGAFNMCRRYSNISFLQRTVNATVNNSLGKITLPYGPINNLVSSVDVDGVAVEVILKGNAFKYIHSPLSSYLELQYTAGYSTLPINLKIAVLNQIAYMYTHRGDDTKGATMSPDAKVILNQIKR